MKHAVAVYLKKCRNVFDEHRSRLSKVIPFSPSADAQKPVKEHLNRAVAEAEKSEEFEIFVNALENGPLSHDLAKLRRREEKEREKAQESGRPIKFKGIDKWFRDTTRHSW